MSGSHWLRSSIATFAIVLGFGAQPVHAAPAELPESGEPRVEMFLQAFLQMTFWPSNSFNQIATRVPAVQKLGPTVKVRLAASGYEEFLQKLLREEAAMTGLEVVFLPDSDKSEDMFVEIHHYTDQLAPMMKICNTLTDVGEQGQTRVHVHADPIGIVKNIRRDTAGFFGCFNRETLKALGLGYDHDHASVLSDQYSRWFLTPIDKMSVRTLYDPRVKPGLHWLGAMAAAREAIVDRMVAEGAPPETRAMGRQWVSNLAQYMIAQADAGQVDFQTQLGFAYAGGEAAEYLPQDLAAGYQWFRRAAEAGDVEAQAQAGKMLVKGEGVPANHSEGMRWLQLAADRGHAEAKQTLEQNDMRLSITIRPPPPEPAR